MKWLNIGIGGIVGTILRFSISRRYGRAVEGAFPWPVFLINMSGSFALGLCYILLARAEYQWLRDLISVGFLGAFTTFSTFSYEVLKLKEEGKCKIAAIYLVVSVVTGPILAYLGVQLARG